eukprot:CAMPEP_0201661220 /NCGR_PEP_ID=MMETSP0494-20130426/3640_1 /ASSEMBLY_ACC=CAM_ASM_000839 /TAXON_ID=420259 /ORGANISM="Thalassiosira gravida, Strain GMp14c1" /LENGTH=482 /DNA_ID=CAMNT_0048139269 /DNA_START=504 /DNA_END=1952 /DNA_ORIENTATION=-
MAACQAFAKASDLMMGWAQQQQPSQSRAMELKIQVVAPLLAFSGFLLPIIVSFSCRRFISCQNNIENSSADDDSNRADLATLSYEDSCESCETRNLCQLEHRSYFPPPTFTVPREIDVESMIDQSQGVVYSAPKETSNNDTVVWLVHLFIHGLFVGAAVIISTCSCYDGNLSFMLIICVITVCHGITLERKVNAATATLDIERARSWSAIQNVRGIFSRSLLTLGGSLAVAVVEGSTTTSRDLVTGVMLAVGGGAYVNIAIDMAIAQVKHHWITCDTTERISSSHHSRRRKTTLENATMDMHCMPCPKESPTSTKNQAPPQVPNKVSYNPPSKAQPIPPQGSARPGGLAELGHLTEKYDWATWKMYSRITSAREDRAKCSFCMGSMEDETAIVTMAQSRNKRDPNLVSQSEEERRLVQTCPSPLHLEIKENQREEVAVIAEGSSIMMVHQECYYGATGGHDCPRRKNRALFEENSMVFQLEL